MSTNNYRSGVRNPDIVQDELKLVHACYLSWRVVSSLPAYFPIPAGTLSTIAKSGEIPKKWRTKLRVQAYEPAPVCSEHGIVHCFDCTSEVVKPKSRPKPINAYKDLLGAPIETLAWALENREEF